MMKRVKRIIGLLAMAALFVSPSLVFASGQMGVYVTPKFIYGYLLGHDLKNTWTEYDYGATDRGKSEYETKGAHAFGGALAVGYDLHKRLGAPVRLELEYTLFGKAESKDSRRSTYSDSNSVFGHHRKLDLGIQTIFTNVYYDFRNSSAFTPYLGFGLGLALVDAKGKHWATGDDPTYSPDKKSSSTNFAWNVSAGIAYAFTDMISLDLGYRLVSPGKAETKNMITHDRRPDQDYFETSHWKTNTLYMHQFMAGVRFTF